MDIGRTRGFSSFDKSGADIESEILLGFDELCSSSPTGPA